MKKKISKKKRLLQTFGFVLIFLLLLGTDDCWEEMKEPLGFDSLIVLINETDNFASGKILGSPTYTFGIAAQSSVSCQAFKGEEYIVAAFEYIRSLNNAHVQSLKCEPTSFAIKNDEDTITVTISQW